MRNKNLKILLVITLVLFLSVNVKAANESDPFDLSQYEENIKEIGIPSKEKVTEIKNKAIEAFEKENYKEAVKLLDKWARMSNWMANLVSSGLEPFYSASYDDRDNFPYSKISKLSSYESMANALKQERNKAMVMQAESLVEISKLEKAVALYTKTLDLIDIDNWELWIRAANGLYEIIGVDNVDK